MSAAGATGPAATEANVAVSAALSSTELEMAEGCRMSERYTRQRAMAVGPKKSNGAATTTPSLIPKKALTEPVEGVALAVSPQLDKPSSHIAQGMILLPSNNGAGQPITASSAAEPFAGLASNSTGNSTPAAQLGPNAGQASQSDTNPPLDGANAVSGDTDAAIGFLQERAVTHPLWHPQLSFKRTDPVTGEEGEFETASFARDAAGNSDWDKVRRWIDNRQGHGNIYWTVNAAKPMDKKPGKKDIRAVVSLHVDLDPDDGEDQDAAEERLTKKIEGYRHHASIIIKSGGGAWGIYDLAEPILIDGDPNKIDDVESRNKQIAHDLGGDNCQNSDRVSRLSGTTNVPNAKKRAKGRRPKLASLHSRSEVRHAIQSFTKAAVDAVTEDNRAPLLGQETKPSEKYEPIEPDDPLLAKLGDKWRVMIAAADYAAKYENDHSRAEFAVVCEAIRVNIDDATIVRVLMDARREFGRHTRERTHYRLPRIISRGHEFAIDPDLARMNAEHAVVCIGGKFGVASWQPSKVHPGRLEMVLSSPENFTFGFSNEKKSWETTDKEGNRKLTKIALGAWWLRQERRRQYNGGVALMPWTDAESENGILNLWTGFGFKPAVGDWSLFKRHMFSNLCGGNEEYFSYLIRWMAWIVQNRKQSGVAVLLRGDEEGTGKGFFARHYGMLFAEHFMQLNNPEHVIGKFNPHLQNLLLLNADEALFVGDPRHRNALWGLTTEPTITIEPKHFPTYKARNFLNHIITTNAKHAVEVTHTARRIFALDVAPNQVGHPEYFDVIEAQLKAGGYAAMLHDLQTVDLSGFDVRQCPKTDALDKQKRLSRKGVDALVESVCNDARVPCEIDGAPGCSRTGDASELGMLDHFLASSKDRELQKPLTVKRRLCSEWGCKSGNAARIWNGTRHVACLQWPALSDLRTRFIKRYGPQTWDSAGVTEWPK